MRILRPGLLLLHVAMLASCGEQIVGWPSTDDVPPTIVSTRPADAAGPVPRATSIIANFSEPMEILSFDLTTFTLRNADGLVATEFTFDGLTAILDPNELLAPGTEFTALVTTDAADLAGNTMEADYEWTFTSGPLVDVTPPIILSTNPDAGAVGVLPSAAVAVTFNEEMDVATVTGASFSLEDEAGVAISGAFAYQNVSLTGTFIPGSALEEGETYTARVNGSVADLAGNVMGSPYEWTFTVVEPIVLTPPFVLITNPYDTEVGVAVDETINAIFNEPVTPGTVNNTSFSVTAGPSATPVAGAVFYDVLTQRGRFTPTAPLAEGTSYTATVAATVTDLDGTPMTAPYVWTFTTDSDIDTLPPFVLVTIPDDEAVDVLVRAKVNAIFNEDMDPSTVSGATFSVRGPSSSVVVGSVAYDPFGRKGTFTPTGPLLAGTTYTATISTGVEDVAGNAMAAPYVWTFQTAAPGLDLVPPFVVLTNPEDEATDVGRSAVVSALFSEDMDPLTMVSTNFGLTGPASSVIAGNFAYNALTLQGIFTPTNPLLPGTEYTATVRTGVEDLAGNAMEDPYTWTFTTGIDRDLVRPIVIFTDPLDEDIDVFLDAQVFATFSEDMDPLTVSELSFELMGPALSPVLGEVEYETLTRRGIFTPDAELLPSTEYTATVTSDVADLAGNTMFEDYVWTFMTEEAPSIWVPINLRSLESFVAVAGAGLTNSNSSGITTLNGDVGLSPTATCLGDGSPCTITNPVINGTLYANDPEGVAATAKVDLISAYVEAMARPPGTTVNDITGMTLVPGVYTSGSTMSVAVGGTVFLDAQGDANAVWVFQIGSSLTVGNNAQILLVNGARAKNVFWAAFASSTLGSNVSFQGNVLAGASNSVGTDSVVVGRLLCTTGQITLLSNNITLPPN